LRPAALARCWAMLTPRLDVPPCDSAAALALARDLGMSFPVAQVLVRRGITDLDAARAWLAAEDEHPASAFNGIDGAIAVLLRHARAGTQITVHGDYDVDGVTSTAILVRALRAVGAEVDWYLPSRSEDGYGLSAATVEKLAARGTKLLVTTDCGITAVDEVALATSLGLDVVVTDHHSPRADGALPEAPIVHPAVCDYPCPDLCAGGVAHKVAGALLEAAGHDAAIALADLDLVALATVADCVPLRGENRRLVRQGLQALGRTEKVGLRALMRVAKVDPTKVDARALGFGLAPRINAAGRLHRADAALELLLTHDETRAGEIAQELDRANADRRFVEQRIAFEAEAQVAEFGPPTQQPAYVLWADGWHPGVIGIVASRLAEKYHRPVVLIALREGEAEGTASGRSIPSFDLLGGLDACASHLLRHGGHRAAAGATVARSELEAFRAAFAAHAASVLAPEDLVPVERVDAVVSGDELGQGLAEELGRLAPFGIGNPAVSLLVPAARLVDPHPMSEGKHVRFTVQAGGIRARAVAFNLGALPDGAAEGRLHATFTLELNEWQGAVEPQLLLRKLLPAVAEAPTLIGEAMPGTAAWHDAVVAAATSAAVGVPALVGGGSVAELHGGGTATRAPSSSYDGPTIDGLAARLRARGPDHERGRGVRDRRGTGLAGTIGALVFTGESVLVVCADAPARARQLTGRLGGYAICSWDALERDPSLADGYHHLVALDPPMHPDQEALLLAGDSSQMAHLAWGEPELRYCRDVLDRDLALRPSLVGTYRALRGGAGLDGALGELPAAAAGRLLAVLLDLGLVELGGGREPGHLIVPPAQHTELERSPAFRAAAARHAEGAAWLTSASATPQAA
jgi:single-stranded-DNA-specific exonuclease